MPKCLICDTEITPKNDSGEHIVLNAFGGTKEIRGLLCRSCNSKAGDSWDAVLYQQLKPLTLAFSVRRSRLSADSKLKITTTAGERLTISPGGTLMPTEPKFEKTAVPGGGTAYAISARTMEELRRILEGLKRKHPEIDVDRALSEAQIKEGYAEGLVLHDLTIGGPQAGRSIVKSCVALAFSAGVDWGECAHAIAYLRDSEAAPCFGYYMERDLVSMRPEGVPINGVAVRADPITGLILGYAEYFGFHRIVACLGEGYRGPLAEQAYFIDPRDGSELGLQVDLRFSRSDIDDIYSYKRIPDGSMEQAFHAVFAPEHGRQADAELQRVSRLAAEKAFAMSGATPGGAIKPEQQQLMIETALKTIEPYLLHLLKRTQKLWPN